MLEILPRPLETVVGVPELTLSSAAPFRSAFDRISAEDCESADLYRAFWRWHFYAGLLVLPFLACPLST